VRSAKCGEAAARPIEAERGVLLAGRPSFLAGTMGAVLAGRPSLLAGTQRTRGSDRWHFFDAS